MGGAYLRETAPIRAVTVMMQLDNLQKLSKDNVDAAMRSFGAITKGVQSAAVEVADYAKRSFEQTGGAFEKLVGARTVESALEIQGEYVRTAYEGFVSQATKMGELATTIAKDAMAPVEGLVAKTASAS